MNRSVTPWVIVGGHRPVRRQLSRPRPKGGWVQRRPSGDCWAKCPALWLELWVLESSPRSHRLSHAPPLPPLTHTPELPSPSIGRGTHPHLCHPFAPPQPSTPPTLPSQMYIDSTFYGLVPDGDQVVAKQLRDSLEELLYRYQVGLAC